MLNLKGPTSKYTCNGAWTDGSRICNIALKSLTVKWMRHLSGKKRERSKLDVNSKEMEKVICKGKLIGI